MEAVSEDRGILVFRYPSTIGRWSAFRRVVCYLAWIAVALVTARYMIGRYPYWVDRLATTVLAAIVIIPALVALWISFRFFWTRYAVIIREADRTICVVRRTPMSAKRIDHPPRAATVVHLVRFDEDKSSSWSVWIEVLSDETISLGSASREEDGRAVARRAAAALGVPVREQSFEEFAASMPGTQSRA